MGEQGQAMMGTSIAAGTDRARVAAERAIACPLLEGVDLHGARGMLVNITASRTLKMRETREIMDTIRSYRSEEHTSELQSLMSISYAVFCLNKKNIQNHNRQQQSLTLMS